MSDPKKWTEVYPYGTPEGDQEAKFFKELARHPKYDYRSVSQLVKSTGLTKQRIEEIISKYAEECNPPLIYPHPTNDEHWGYWERCPDQVKSDFRGISRKDKDQRIDKQLSGNPTIMGAPGTAPSTPSMTGMPTIAINPPVIPSLTTPSMTGDLGGYDLLKFKGKFQDIPQRSHPGRIYSAEAFQRELELYRAKYAPKEMRDGISPPWNWNMPIEIRYMGVPIHIPLPLPSGYHDGTAWISNEAQARG